MKNCNYIKCNIVLLVSKSSYNVLLYSENTVVIIINILAVYLNIYFIYTYISYKKETRENIVVS